MQSHASHAFTAELPSVVANVSPRLGTPHSSLGINRTRALSTDKLEKKIELKIFKERTNVTTAKTFFGKNGSTTAAVPSCAGPGIG